jgi:UDP-N-acetylmuramoyl-L-alanyl-D-glutamate--2,6-diaminopimelate ligase
MRLGDLVREIPGATLLGSRDVLVRGVRHDSRAIEPGDVFVAREGGRVSGLSFLNEAIQRGAAAVIARRGVPRVGHTPLLEVEDVPLALALASAAVYGHPTFGLEVVGITGTNGKTTTTLLTRAVVNASGGRCGTIGTLGAELEGWVKPSAHTSPEADELARTAREMRDHGATHLVMEVSSIALTAKRADAVRFRVAAFTNLTQDHLDYHGTMEGYAAAKLRLFSELGPGAAAVNVRDPFGLEVVRAVPSGTRTVTYSSAADVGAPDVYPTHLEMRGKDGAPGIALTAATPVGELRIDSPLVGAHNVENLLCAASIGLCLDIDLETISAALSAPVAVPGRLERCDDPKRDDVVVLVDYAHTPDALARVLASVRPIALGRVICVFGCGGDRDPGKRPLMGEAAARGADLVFVTNDNPRSEDPRVIAEQALAGVTAVGTPHVVELDRRTAIVRAVEAANAGDVVLVAGKGHETYQIVGATTLAFDDRAVARSALAERAERRGGAR